VDAITLNFLGGFQVSSTGAAISRIRGDKIRGLLAFLAIEADRPHARAALAPDQRQEHTDDCVSDSGRDTAIERAIASKASSHTLHTRAAKG
jgi:hypothetical protein